MEPVVVDSVAGAVAGMAGVMVGAPLDLARVRMQQSGSAYSSMWHCLTSAVRREGARSLFKGMSYPLVTMAAQQSLCFQAFGSATRYLAPAGPVYVGELQNMPHGGAAEAAAVAGDAGMVAGPGWLCFVAGCYAGAVQSIVTVPQELLKIRLQVQQKTAGQPGYTGPVAMFWSIAKKEGLAGLYRGTVVTLLRDVPSYGVYFVANEATKDILEPGSSARGACSGLTELLAGGTAGAIAWASIYPVEVVKSRVQAEGKPWRDVVRAMRVEGAVAFSRGMPATLARAFVVNAAIFYGYGVVSRALGG